MVDWSLLPKDLLELINGRFETCFEAVHLRSVCSLWRSAIPRRSYKQSLSVDYLLPIFSDNPRFRGDKNCILKKIPNFLLRYQTPFGADCLIVGISESIYDKQKLVSSLPGFGFTSEYGMVLNTLSSQIIPLDHHYVIKFNATTTIRYITMRRDFSERVAFLSEDGGDFTVVAGVLDTLMMYRSSEERWIKIEGQFRSYQDMVSFKGRFYVVDKSGRGRVFVIEPSLEVSEIRSVTQAHECYWEALVVSGDAELLLVQRFTPRGYHDENMHTWFRLFKLEEGDQRRWVRVSDLEERVVFLGINRNFCYSAKEIPGVKGNCVMFIEPNSNTIPDRILVFDLGTKKTTQDSTLCRGMSSMLSENRESVSIGDASA
ncbi:unnamed protein product [Eruca vesicaria subsp. sativa]|uniref:KIB1-4 beta-propeller domain-containing protein n=1 Tax=Eruca vesicaria subsp. sativa TaxID=29727 RepID=A0ABC8KXF5_ERUVS|nr:unnamed protein product [Eruca vesicaria subsp. sativa]